MEEELQTYGDWERKAKQRQADAAWAALRADPSPCDCSAAEEHAHTVGEHYRESCRTRPECGGCWDCICKQHAYYESLREKEKANAQTS